MENWGLVTYRETALLADPENTSSNTKQWVALVVGESIKTSIYNQQFIKLLIIKFSICMFRFY